MPMQRHDARGTGLEHRSLVPQERAALSRWKRMWEEALLTYTEGHRRLFGEEPLGALEEMELRRDLPVLKGRLQAIAEALGLPDPTPPAGRL